MFDPDTFEDDLDTFTWGDVVIFVVVVVSLFVGTLWAIGTFG